MRTIHNPALEYAIAQANDLRSGLVVVMGITDRYPESNLRHHRFYLQGVADVARALRRRRISFVVREGDPVQVALTLAGAARMVVTDRGYLRHHRQWRRRLVSGYDGPVVEVEGDVVVPVATASDKREWAARTIRPKIQRHRDRFLVDLEPEELHRPGANLVDGGIDAEATDAILGRLELDRGVGPAPFTGGEVAAVAALESFVARRLGIYAEHRNQPHTDEVSYLSMYLHFGHISPVVAARAAQASGAPTAQIDTFLEELVVRRELNFNFVTYEPDYDRYGSLPEWCRTTLDTHRGDVRHPVYDAETLAGSGTHDRYWNAAMTEMRHTGYMHNYMRMYWGKKIIEWSPSPEAAHAVTLELNNRYLLDGRDPNSYGNVGWVFGLHDRPWAERPIFGTVRYMAASGLERKTDPDAYVAKVDRLTGRTLL